MTLRFWTILALIALASSEAAASNYCVRDMPIGTYERFVPKKTYKSENGRLTQYLPTYSATAKLDSNKLSFTADDGKTYRVALLNSGDDYNGWDGIHELEDGWLYVAGAQYNHVIHLKQNAEQQWQADRTIRLYDDEGLAERLARLIIGMDAKQIKRDNLTAIQRVKGHAVYSNALHKLFYPAALKELKNGELVGWGDDQAKTYVGDIARLKTAIFKATNGQLYSYLDEQFKPVANGRVEPHFVGGERLESGLIHDVPSLNRSFYSIRSSIYELVKRSDGYELEKIPLPHDVGELLFTQFIPVPGNNDVAVLTRGNIFLLSSLEGVFARSIPDKQINTTGSDVLPAFIPELEGILFSTGGAYVSKDKKEYFHLLKECTGKQE